jgi:hypothetical protein
MRFHGHEDVDKDDLDRITDVVITHCLDVHCTCDPVVEFLGKGYILHVDEDGIQAVAGGSIEVKHTDYCYSSNRGN